MKHIIILMTLCSIYITNYGMETVPETSSNSDSCEEKQLITAKKLRLPHQNNIKTDSSRYSLIKYINKIPASYAIYDTIKHHLLPVPETFYEEPLIARNWLYGIQTTSPNSSHLTLLQITPDEIRPYASLAYSIHTTDRITTASPTFGAIAIGNKKTGDLWLFNTDNGAIYTITHNMVYTSKLNTEISWHNDDTILRLQHPPYKRTLPSGLNLSGLNTIDEYYLVATGKQISNVHLNPKNTITTPASTITHDPATKKAIIYHGPTRTTTTINTLDMLYYNNPQLISDDGNYFIEMSRNATFFNLIKLPTQQRFTINLPTSYNLQTIKATRYYFYLISCNDTKTGFGSQFLYDALCDTFMPLVSSNQQNFFQFVGDHIIWIDSQNNCWRQTILTQAPIITEMPK